MDKLSEEEIIEIVKKEIKFRKNNTYFKNCVVEPKILQGLLDLYNKEKEKNKELEKELNTIKDIYYNTNDLEELSDVLGGLLSNLKEE